MQNAQQQQYLKVQVETASPGELTLLLYQEMVKSLLLAKRLYSQSQFEDMNKPLHKVRVILNELIVTLNMEYDIAKQLRSLYEFYSRYIADFIIKRGETMLDDIIVFARDIAETWKQMLLSLKNNGNKYMYDENQGLANPIEKLLFVYRKIMDNLCFDQYVLYEQKATELFEQIISMELTESDRLLLSEVQIIHAQIIQVIIEEKRELNEEIELMESKKRVSNQYGRLSNNYDVGAFFVDYKK